MAQQWIKNVISAITPGHSQLMADANIIKINMERAAEEALHRKGITISRDQLKKLFDQKQNTDVHLAIVNLKHKARIIATQTSRIIGFMLKDDPQFARINSSARDTVHLLMYKQDKFIKKTLPLYENYKEQLANIRNDRNNGNILYTTTDMEAKIENLQEKIKADIDEMKNLYTKGQYQTQIVAGLEKICIDTSKLSASELSTLSSADLFKSLDSANKKIGAYIEKNSQYINNMIEIKP